MKTELENIEAMSPAKLFKPKFMPTLLKAIELEVTAEVPDVETPEGRDAIKSLAYKVARSKTTIDDLGKKHVAGIKAEATAIDEIRKLSRDFLDNLKATVRTPLTTWEDAEQKRIDKILGKVNNLRDLGETLDDNNVLQTAAELAESLATLRAIKITKIYGEYQDEAINAKNASIVQLTEAIPLAEVREREAEDARLYAEQQAENQRVEEEQRIARDAVASADLESANELKRIQDEAAQEQADKEKRERDTKHKGRIHREAAEALVKINPSLDDVLARQIVKSIVKHQIPNVTLNY
jgi:hypothetical protein